MTIVATAVGWVIKRIPASVLVYIAAGLLAALCVSLVALAIQNARLDSAISAREATQTKLDAALAQLANARESSTAWRDAAEKLAAKLAQEIEQAKERAKRDALAVAKATEREREADATLKAWLDRYAAATRAAECAAIERMRICEVQE